MASQDQSSKEDRSKPQCRHCNVSPAVVSMWNDVNYFSALHPSRNACQLVLTCCGGEQQSSTASWFLETWQGICRSCQAGLANPVVKSPKSSKVLAALPSRTGCSAWLRRLTQKNAVAQQCTTSYPARFGTLPCSKWQYVCWLIAFPTLSLPGYVARQPHIISWYAKVWRKHLAVQLLP